MSDDTDMDLEVDSGDEEMIAGEGSDEEQVDMTLDSQMMESIDYAGINNFSSVVQTYNAFMWNNPAQLVHQARVQFNIPTSFLPLALQNVYGFSGSPVILEVILELTEYSWTKKPNFIDYSHPQYVHAYIGRPLIVQVINDFFSEFYKPRESYRSASYLLSPPGIADLVKIHILRSEGYDSNQAENALRLFKNDLEKARDFLRTGGDPPQETAINITYKECPLLYLVLEICEAFLDLADHCCNCRTELKNPGIKPSVCESPVCTFAMTQLGVGNQVFQEIQRDPLAADLVFSAFATSAGNEFMDPAPPFPGLDRATIIKLCEEMPSMKDIARRYCSDVDMLKGLGERRMELLRWVILSNRAQLISLPEELRLKQFSQGGVHQFMIFLSTPKKEDIFRAKQAKYGSVFLWHGSSGDRWHSILRNGLINATGTKLMQNGSALGSGIYFARSSETSNGYSRVVPNNYKNSALGRDLKIIGLCEVAQVPQLNNHGWAHTLTDETACIVRFLIVGMARSIDVLQNPPTDIPTLKDVLEHHARK